MNDIISSMNDATAKQILDAFVRARLSTEHRQTELTDSMCEALQDEFAVSPSADAPSDGDLAREALLILAEDPEVREHIEMLAKAGPTRGFDLGAGLAITSAVLLVLQTHIRFERQDSGKWSLLIEKKPTKEGLLKPLVQRLLSVFTTRGNG